MPLAMKLGNLTHLVDWPRGILYSIVQYSALARVLSTVRLMRNARPQKSGSCALNFKALPW